MQNTKIKKLPELKRAIDELKANGKRIVFTNGCFDILHIGHIRCLTQAKQLGDVLVVGINSDESVEKLKGKGHPIMPDKERAEILSALECVDYVVIFHDTNPNYLIEQLEPDFHVKGGDYSRSQIPEAKLVESLGGKAVIVEQVKGKSTNNIIQRILKTHR